MSSDFLIQNMLKKYVEISKIVDASTDKHLEDIIVLETCAAFLWEMFPSKCFTKFKVYLSGIGRASAS